MILAALHNAGGQEYLVAQARTNPVAFLALLGKVLPMTLAGNPSDPLIVEIVRFSEIRGSPAGRRSEFGTAGQGNQQKAAPLPRGHQ